MTTSTSSMRNQGLSIVNCTGNQTMYSSTKPFLFGVKQRPAPLLSNGEYTIIKSGQFASLAKQPYDVTFI